MHPLTESLFPHEWQALLDALRRDLRVEISHAQTDAQQSDYHYANARLNVRLLELLGQRLRGGTTSFNAKPRHRTFPEKQK